MFEVMEERARQARALYVAGYPSYKLDGIGYYYLREDGEAILVIGKVRDQISCVDKNGNIDFWTKESVDRLICIPYLDDLITQLIFESVGMLSINSDGYDEHRVTVSISGKRKTFKSDSLYQALTYAYVALSKSRSKAVVKT